MFDKKDIDDVLKSLYFIDHKGGHVLGIDYDSPIDKNTILEKTNIIDHKKQGLQSIWNSLRGKAVKLKLKDNSVVSGLVTGWQNEPYTLGAILSVLTDTSEIKLISLEDIESIESLSQEVLNDLKHFLEVVNLNEKEASLLIRLNDGEHDLEFSYIAPTPVWKISYRIHLLKNKLILSAWCIFENIFPEDLHNVQITLVSGMPISFQYKLYESFTPKRIKVKEEPRTIETPIEFDSVIQVADGEARKGKEPQKEEKEPIPQMLREEDLNFSNIQEPEFFLDSALASRMEDSEEKESEEEVQEISKPVIGFHSTSREEVFEYELKEKVSVSRSKTAMIPFMQFELEYKKELIYNYQKYKPHPVFVIRFPNETGAILETGPVTIFEEGRYSGESILRINPEGSEITLSYAVDLTTYVSLDVCNKKEFHSISLEKGNMVFHEYAISIYKYKFWNQSKTPKKVLVEHPKSENRELFETPKPTEETFKEYRFEVNLPAQVEVEFSIKERKLISKGESLKYINYSKIQKMLREKILTDEVQKKVLVVLEMKEEIFNMETKIGDLKTDKDDLLEKQENIRKNITTLQEISEQKHRAALAEELIQNERKIKDIEKEMEDSRLKVKNLETKLQEYLKSL